MSDIFHSSKYSISRAKHHISDFERQSIEFFKTNPYSFVVDVDVDTSEQIHKVKLIKPMPVALPAIASDAVTNLRSALDQAIYGITSALGVNSTYFPIAKDAFHFENGVNGRCKELPKEIVALIRSFKAYKGGNDLLWALNEVCNTNKHAIICPVALTTSNVTFSSGVFYGGIKVRAPIWDRTKNEMELFRQPKGGTSNTNIEVTTFIAMRDVEFVDGQPADAVLKEFVRIVEGIVMAIEFETIRIGL